MAHAEKIDKDARHTTAPIDFFTSTSVDHKLATAKLLIHANRMQFAWNRHVRSG